MTADGRATRLGEIIAAVARQCLADRGARRIALLDDESPEADFAARILGASLGDEGVVRVGVRRWEVEPLLHLAGPEASPERVHDEVRRLRARLVPDAVVANPANKTELLLGGELPPEPFLPLGDLYASEVAELAGGWSASPEVRAVAQSVGGVEALDAALRRWVDGRAPAGLDDLPPHVAALVELRFAAGRPSRMAPRLVPKVGGRTIGLDLFQ